MALFTEWQLVQEKLKKVVNIFDLADSIPYEEESSTIDILLGNDYYLDLVMCTGEQRKRSFPRTIPYSV